MIIFLVEDPFKKSRSALKLIMPRMLGETSKHEKNWISTTTFEFKQK